MYNICITCLWNWIAIKMDNSAISVSAFLLVFCVFFSINELNYGFSPLMAGAFLFPFFSGSNYQNGNKFLLLRTGFTLTASD